jgi:signal transduction histidine kinase/CheY-like chemotaxis protein
MIPFLKKFNSRMEEKIGFQKNIRNAKSLIIYGKILLLLRVINIPAIIFLNNTEDELKIQILLLLLFAGFITIIFIKIAQVILSQLNQLKKQQTQFNPIYKYPFHFVLFLVYFIEIFLLQNLELRNFEDQLQRGAIIFSYQFIVILQGFFFLSQIPLFIATLTLNFINFGFIMQDCSIQQILVTFIILLKIAGVSVYIHKSIRDQYRKNFLLKERLNVQINLYEDLLNCMQQPLIVYSEEKGIIFQNEASIRSPLKLRANDFIQTASAMITENGQSLKNFLEQAAMSEVNIIYNRLNFKYKNENIERSILVNIHPLNFPEINNTVSISLKDITEKMELEEKKIRNEYTNKLICTFSHELRTPLNGIMGMLSSLKDKVPKQDSHLLKSAMASSALLKYKINDILDYAQLQNHNFSLHKFYFSPAGFLASIEKILKSEVLNNPIELKFKTDDAFEKINADWERLSQIILNLMTNGIKYTSKGFVCLSIKHENLHLRFKVKDTGLGMSRQKQEKLFKFLAPNSPRRKDHKQPLDCTLKMDWETSGLPGMGLTVSQMIAKQMGARIVVRSSVGKGSCFTFSIKIGESPSPAKVGLTRAVKKLSSNELRKNYSENREDSQKEQDVSEISEFDGIDYEIPNEKRKIVHERNISGGFDFVNPFKQENVLPFVLIVDDNTMNRFVIKSLLKKCNCIIREAKDGAQAVRKARRQIKRRNPNFLIFMDIDMPILDGIQATKQIRRIEAQYPPIILACTAFASELDRQKCINSGMDHFFTKPITANIIKIAISLFNRNIQKLT